MKKKPLYQQAADLLRQQYVEGKAAGVRLPGERELEKLLNVSSITVRAALRELERLGCVERRPGSGTYVMSLPEGEKDVALLFELDISDPSLSPYYLKLCQEVRHQLFRLGVSCRPYFGHLRLGVEIDELTCREVVRDLRLNRLSGLISIVANPDQHWVSEFRKYGIPLVGSNWLMDYVVEADTPQIAREAVERFASHGRQHLCVIGWKQEHSDRWALSERAQESGLACTEVRIPFQGAPFNTDKAWESFRAIWEGRERPDCLFIEDDMLFAKVQEILLSTAGAPLETVLFGTDAVPIIPQIPLTHCSYSITSKARLLAERMKAALEGTQAPHFSPVPATFREIGTSPLSLAEPHR